MHKYPTCVFGDGSGAPRTHTYTNVHTDCITITAWIFSEIPLIEQFRIRRVNKNRDVHIAWLENRICITYGQIKRVRVFADRAPFEELPEGIEFKHIIDPGGMVAFPSSRSLFVSDGFEVCVWKIQFPQRTMSKIETGFAPEQVSITPNNELLVVIESYYGDGQARFRINIHQMTDFSRTKSILLPRQVLELLCAVQSPNMNYIISHMKEYSGPSRFCISILSTNGEIIRTFDPDVFEFISQDSFCPFFLAIMENGDIFVADRDNNRVFLFNPQMTDYQIISHGGYEPTSSSQIVYIKEKKQLLVYEDPGVGQTNVDAQMSVFHLSPCNLDKERNDGAEPAKNELRIGRKRKALSHTILSKYRNLNYGI